MLGNTTTRKVISLTVSDGVSYGRPQQARKDSRADLTVHIEGLNWEVIKALTLHYG